MKCTGGKLISLAVYIGQALGFSGFRILQEIGGRTMG